MKVIDLAIGFSKGIIPPKIKYKGVVYTYWKNFKEYLLVENNTIIKSLSINVEQFNDEVEIIEDTPKITESNMSLEDLLKNTTLPCNYVRNQLGLEAIGKDKKIEKLICLNTDYHIERKKYGALTNEEIVLDIQTLKNYINEIIDKVNGE